MTTIVDDAALLAACAVRGGAAAARTTQTSAAEQSGRISGARRRLRRLPFGARRQGVCRRPQDGHAARHHLFDQHHARSRDRHRQLHVSQDFDRALRQGIAKDGHRLYPAMPYPSYAKLTDADVAALYDFFMKEVPPVHQANKPNEIPSLSRACAGRSRSGTSLFTDSGSYVTKREHDAAWNRGAYLVAGPRPLRRLPHAARLGLPGKGARREQRRPISRARCSMPGRARPARRSCAPVSARWSQGRSRQLPQDRPQRERRGVRLDDRCRQQFDALSVRRRPQRDRGLSEIAAGDIDSSRPTPTTMRPPRRCAAAMQRSPAPRSMPASAAAVPWLRRQGLCPYMPPLAGNPVVLDDDPSSLINLVLNGSNRWSSRARPMPIACRNSACSSPTSRSPTW